MAGKEKADVRFVVDFTEANYGGTDRYAHIKARAYILARDRYDGKVTVHSPDSYSIDGPRAPEVEYLQITSQLDGHSREWYGYHIHYDDTPFDLKRAESAVKVLRRIDHAMTRIADEYGFPRDLVTFMVRAVKAVTRDPKPFLRRVPADQDWEGTGFRSMGPDDLRCWVDDQTAKWRVKHGITSESD